jgi:hypothetical protein
MQTSQMSPKGKTKPHFEWGTASLSIGWLCQFRCRSTDVRRTLHLVRRRVADVTLPLAVNHRPGCPGTADPEIVGHRPNHCRSISDTGAPNHKSTARTESLETEHPPLLGRRHNSPRLSPIEAIWGMKKKLETIECKGLSGLIQSSPSEQATVRKQSIGTRSAKSRHTDFLFRCLRSASNSVSPHIVTGPAILTRHETLAHSLRQQIIEPRIQVLVRLLLGV